MKACDLFIRLLSLSALVIGVCSMPYKKLVFKHVWSRTHATRPQTLGNCKFETDVSVDQIPRPGEVYGIYVNNPLEVAVMVRVKVKGSDLLKPITRHIIQPNTIMPWTKYKLCELGKYPTEVKVEYFITKADYKRLRKPLSQSK
ncbi:hypothetical protein PTTG_28313 [Puccinia triticina 1-1 BBBD Race 1]|uniref:Uncharacterized protein n=2 Tax=Puccinia triticina TaxID=208348 RepID=A0A180GCK0_PUCT1|nr:uncharacterized protein PtA15_5A817 [Puccinia triticina]OAV90415.1 hypothetical protein PTTG_28313 [Puccinia triticina 1-1 BBBD Race 1]WAQ85243.1 hypothetical protein PtA15_5A817 [Puccinia triticina]WAR58565.1 hypothetical protein PtB15_5B799 [Puccinia triticina]